MSILFLVLTVFLSSLVVSANCADTNVLIIPGRDHRAGAVFFVDECLTRGLTNSISISDLRKWAISTILVYQQREAVATSTNSFNYPSVLEADVPQVIRTIQNRIPSCLSEKAIPIKDWDEFVQQYSKTLGVPKAEAERRLRTIGPDPDPPQIGFWRSSQGAIEAVTISWYLYGVIVGPESFKPNWEHAPWYHRKLAEGIYLYHGYK